ncbi:MAG: hypothetical protein RR087_01085 [Oscillospiraceae bacterium]
MPDCFKYIFRFCCDPGFNDEREVKELAKFVKAARIDDVMVFANVEEINTGHMSFDEQDVYMDLMRRVKEVLMPLGVTMSINQWHSIMHADIGKKLRADQHFRLMKDPLGNESTLCVCPRCEEWQNYITHLYARYAELSPNMVWVEDDFRLHNHSPLVWGGCFCDEHMKLFSKAAGKTLTREEFVNGVLSPGEVHQYRQIWLDDARQEMRENAEAIGAAVHAVNPEIRVGLMTSAPHIHAAEARDWHGVLNGFASATDSSNNSVPPVCRIHLPGYIEPTPSKYMMNFNAVSMLTRAMLPTNTEVYPELENYPYTRFAKSRAFTRFQLLAAMPLRLAGITIDLYDLNGSGIMWDEGYQDTLYEVKDYLIALTESGIFDEPSLGVTVLYSELSSYTLHTQNGDKMEELYPAEMLFASLLPSFGIPVKYSDEYNIKGKIVAISGQYLRNLTPLEIQRLFTDNFIILDGTAAEVLYSLGLGELANITNAHFETPDQGLFTYDEVCNGKEYCGLEKARTSAAIISPPVLNVEYCSPYEAITQFYNSYRKRTMNGITLAKSNVMVFPFGNFESFPEMPAMLLTSVRKAIFSDVIMRASEEFESLPIVLNAPYLNPYCYILPSKLAIYLVNASTDDYNSIDIYLTRSCKRVTLLDGQPVKFLQNGDVITIKHTFKSMQACMFIFE